MDRAAIYRFAGPASSCAQGLAYGLVSLKRKQLSGAQLPTA